MNTHPNTTILVVDDDEAIRDTLREIFLRDGFNTEIAENGYIATRIVREKWLDLVFLDFELPGQNGIDVLKEIKQININLPVVMLTGYSGEEINTWAINAGAFELLRKPIQLSQIRQTIHKILLNM